MKEKKFINTDKKKLFFLVSSLFLTFILTINFSVIVDYSKYTGDTYYIKLWYASIACIISVPFYLCLYEKVKIVCLKNKAASICSIVLTICFCSKLIQDTARNMEAIKYAAYSLGLAESVSNNLSVWLSVACVITVFAGYKIIYYIVAHLIKFIQSIVFDMDKIEIFFLTVYLLFGLGLISYFYSQVNGQWTGVDLVYQMDSGFMYSHYYPVFSFGYDFDWDIGNGGIRHPLATFFSYPIHLLSVIPIALLGMVRNIQGIMYAFFQTVIIAFSGIFLERITRNKWTLLIYGLSFPSVFFCVFLEKYPLAVIFLLIFTVKTLRKEDNGMALMAAGGMTITSCFLGFFYGKSNKFAERIKEWVHIFFSFFATVVAAGRIHYIIDYSYLSKQNNICFFKVSSTSIIDRGKSFSNLILSCFIPLKSKVINGQYFWSDMQTKFSWLGYLIILILAYTIAFYWKNKEVQILGCWVLWALIQVVITGFSSDASCVFGYYFSWAVIGLFMIGTNHLLHNKYLKCTTYLILTVAMISLDYIQMREIFRYLLQTTPVS